MAQSLFGGREFEAGAGPLSSQERDPPPLPPTGNAGFTLDGGAVSLFRMASESQGGASSPFALPPSLDESGAMAMRAVAESAAGLEMRVSDLGADLFPDLLSPFDLVHHVKVTHAPLSVNVDIVSHVGEALADLVRVLHVMPDAKGKVNVGVMILMMVLSRGDEVFARLDRPGALHTTPSLLLSCVEKKRRSHDQFLRCHNPISFICFMRDLTSGMKLGIKDRV